MQSVRYCRFVSLSEGSSPSLALIELQMTTERRDKMHE